jgi:hypothetical protein
MFILFCILRFRLCLLYISMGQCLSDSVFYDFIFVYCTSRSVNVYLIQYSTISFLFIVHFDRPMFILFSILRFRFCLLYISIGQCLSYSVFYDFSFFLFFSCLFPSVGDYSSFNIPFVLKACFDR